MALGLITVLEEVKSGGTGVARQLRCSIVGDGAYPTGGTVGFTALLRAATLAAGVKGSVKLAEIVDVQDLGPAAGTVIDGELHYDHTNDTLMSTVRSTAAEVANTTNLAGNTYGCLITVK